MKPSTPRVLIVVGAMVIVSACLWMYFTMREGGHQDVVRPGLTSTASHSSPKTEDEEEESAPFKSEEDHQKWRLAEMIKEGRKANVPVCFYGKVIDQFGAAILGVKVTAELYSFDPTLLNPEAIVGEKTTEIIAMTDGEGRFSFVNRTGYSLLIKTLEKEGYEPHSSSHQDYPYSGNIAGGLHHPDKNEPVVFKMWKQAGAEPLFAYHYRGGIQCDGTPLIVDFSKRTKGRCPARIQISLKREPLHIQKAHDKYDWVASIDVLDGGGLIQSENDFMNLAPESGYESSFAVEMRRDNPDWQSGCDVHFYVKTQNGRYGRITLHLVTNYEPPPTSIRVDGYLNPTGSRNLEYDAQKAID